MKKYLLVFMTFFLIFVGLVVFLRQTPKIVNPLINFPATYDLVTILEKNGLASTVPVMTAGAIQASISGILVSFSPEKDLPQQVRALQLVLPKVKMDGKKVLEIDLRFNKVVIRYAER